MTAGTPDGKRGAAFAGVIRFLGPAILFAIGVAFLRWSLALDIGSPARMGPGFLPLCLAVILCLLSAALLLAAGLGAAASRPAAVPDVAPADLRAGLRGFVCIAAGVAGFVLVLPPFGLLPAVFVSTVILTRARPGLDALRMALLALCVTGGVWLGFIVLLGLTIDPYRWPF